MYEQNNRRLTNNNTHEIANEQLIAFKKAINTALEGSVKHSRERKQGSNARSNNYVQQTIQLDNFIKELQQAVLQHNSGESLWYAVNNSIQKKMPSLVSINKLTFGMFNSDDPCTTLAIDLNRIIKHHYSLNELKQSDQATRIAAMATAAIVMEEIPEESENDLPVSQQQLTNIQNILNQVASQLGNPASSTDQVIKESKSVELKPLSVKQNNNEVPDYNLSDDSDSGNDNEEEEENIFRKQNIKLKFFNLNRKTEELAAQTTALTGRVEIVEVEVKQNGEKIEELADTVIEQKSDILVNNAHIRLMKITDDKNNDKDLATEEKIKNLTYKNEVVEEERDRYIDKFNKSQAEVAKQAKLIELKNEQIKKHEENEKISDKQIAGYKNVILVLKQNIASMTNKDTVISPEQLHELSQKMVTEVEDNVQHAMENLPSVLRKDEVRVIPSNVLVIDNVINDLQETMKQVDEVSVGNNLNAFHKPVRKNGLDLTINLAASSVNDLVGNLK